MLFTVTFTPMKYLNAILNGSSYITGLVTKRPVILGMPPAVGVELTNNCNLICPECSSGAGKLKRERGFMKVEDFNIITEELGQFLFNMNLYFQGEPMLHPQFFKFLEKSAGIITTVSTNGHFINEENAIILAESGLHRIIISLDGISEDTYTRYRVNGNLRKVVGGIMLLSEAIKKTGSKLKTEIQALKNKYNEHEMSEIGAFAEKAGAHLSVKSMQVCDIDDAGEWMPADPRYSRYKKAGSTYSIKNKLPRRCARLWYNPVITWDMKVVPCCFDKDAEFVMGDMHKQSFREIWHGKKYSEFRLMLLKSRESISICRNCTSGLRLK